MDDFNKAAVTCYCSRNCKISIPKFNIMSAVYTEILDDGAKNARIFKVCNYLIYKRFHIKRYKISFILHGFATKCGVKCKI